MVRRNPKVRGAKSSGTAWNGPSQITTKKAKKGVVTAKVHLAPGNIDKIIKKKQPRVKPKTKKKQDTAYLLGMQIARNQMVKDKDRIQLVKDETTGKLVSQIVPKQRRVTREEADKIFSKYVLGDYKGIKKSRAIAKKDWGISAGKNINKKQTTRVHLQTPSFESANTQNPRVRSGRVDPATAYLRHEQIRHNDNSAAKYDIVGKLPVLGINKYSALKLKDQIKVLRGQRRII